MKKNHLIPFFLLIWVLGSLLSPNPANAEEKKASSFDCNGTGPYSTIIYFLNNDNHQARYHWDGIDKSKITQLQLNVKVLPVTGYGGTSTSADVNLGLGTKTGETDFQTYRFDPDVSKCITITDISNRVTNSGGFDLVLKWKGKEHIGVAKDWVYLSFTTVIPKDSDGDGLSDDLETAGWDITIYRMRTGEIVQTVHVNSNPLKADTDGDGLTDYVEFQKSNPQHPDTDGDGLRDNIDDNLVGIENQAPNITNFSWSAKLSLGKYVITVNIKAEDQGSQANIAEIKVKVSSTFDSSNRSENDGDYSQKHNIYWFSGAVVSGFDIEVWIKDKNGNVRHEKRHLDSFLEWVKGGVEKAWDQAVDYSVTYQLRPFPAAWQGPFGLCAACSVLEIAHYYFKNYETFNTVSSKSGDSNVYDGMTTSQEIQYLRAIGVYDREVTDPTFDQIKQEIIGSRDPILGNFREYYGVLGEKNTYHAIVIVGFLDLPGKQFVIIQDSNVAVTTYLMPWDYLRRHLESLLFVNGTGMAG